MLLTPYPRGQPPALVEIKNSLYYTSHSARPPPNSPTPSLPFGRFYSSPRRNPPLVRPFLSSSPLPLFLLSSHPFLSRSCHLTRPLFSPLFFAPPPSTHHIPPLWRRLVRADRLNMRPAIPDGTNIIKVRPHAKPVKYRRALPQPRPSPRARSSLREVDTFRSSANNLGHILPSSSASSGLYCSYISRRVLISLSR